MVNTKKIVSFIIAIVIAILIIFTLAKVIDWSETWGTIKNASLIYLGLGVLSILASTLSRALRWWFISGSDRKDIFLYIKSTCLGYLGNFILPFRTGELIKIWVIYKLTKRKAIKVTFSLIADRSTDFLIVSATMICVIPFIKLPDHLNSIKIISIIIFFIIITLFISILILKEKIYFFNKKFSSSAKKLLNIFSSILKNLYEILEVLKKSPFSIIFYLLIISFFDLLSIWLVMMSIGWDIPLISVPLYLVVMSFASVLPATPGYIGLYQVSAIVSFGLFNISINEAVAYSILLQGITAFSYLMAGSLALLSMMSKMYILFGKK